MNRPLPPRISPEARRAWLASAAAVGMLACLGQAAAGHPWGPDRLIWDAWLVQDAPPQAAEPMALVEVDDRTLASLGAAWPLPRATWAELVAAVGAAAPRVVAISVVFAEPEPTVDFDLARAIAAELDGPAQARALARIDAAVDRGQGDAALVRAVGAGVPVILGAIALGANRPSAGLTLVAPLPTLRVAAAGVGALNLDVDSDGVTRRYPVGRRTPTMPRSLAWEVARSLDAPTATLDGAAATDHGSPLLRWGRFSEVTRVSAIDVLSADARALAALKGRVVFIGVTATASERTVALAEADLSGAEFHALGTAALLSGGFVRSRGAAVAFGFFETLIVLAVAAWVAQDARRAAVLVLPAMLAVHAAVITGALALGYSLAAFPAVLGLGAVGVASVGLRVADVLQQRAQLRREMARLQAAAQRNASLAAMGNLVASVAHEVRNPLFGITSTLDALDATSADPALKAFVDVLRSEALRLRVLMDDLLLFGKPAAAAASREPIDASIGLGLEAVRLLAATHGVALQRLGQTTQPLHLMRERLSLVFKNVLENAIQHSPRGGRVTVSIADVRASGQSGVECRVRDEGPGFADEDRSRVFEPFFSRRSGGTGLGLAIAQRILEEHGGTIDARNHPDGGAEVVITLPTHG